MTTNTTNIHTNKHADVPTHVTATLAKEFNSFATFQLRIEQADTTWEQCWFFGNRSQAEDFIMTLHNHLATIKWEDHTNDKQQQATNTQPQTQS